METVRSCGCKGIRTCLICEIEYNIPKLDIQNRLKHCPSYVYCPSCDKCWPGWNGEDYQTHPHHQGNPIDFPGVYIKLDFLNENESTTLTRIVDDMPWESSQSGRRKQNFGPKCNFKKKKLRLGLFNGFPKTTEWIQKKFQTEDVLMGFQTIEQCTLEYDPKRGASIDPHIDDCWIWGERIVTVNVLGDSVLTMFPYRGTSTRYNLASVPEYSTHGIKDDMDRTIDRNNVVVRLPMPAKSLMVLYGSARYYWEHCVLREDITSRRVCLAYREFTPPYLPNGALHHESAEILTKASTFW